MKIVARYDVNLDDEKLELSFINKVNEGENKGIFFLYLPYLSQPLPEGATLKIPKNNQENTHEDSGDRVWFVMGEVDYNTVTPDIICQNVTLSKAEEIPEKEFLEFLNTQWDKTL